MKTKMSPNGAILQYAYWVWSLDYVCCVVFIRWGICVLGIVPLLRSSIRFYLCVPRVPYRALPSFHPGLCRSVALTGLIVVLGVCGIVFVKCVWVCKWIIAFVRVFVCDCMGRGVVFVKCAWVCVNGLLHSFVYLYVIVLFVVLGGGVNCWCGRVISPNGAILPHSPERKP